jgi:NAD+ kinase
MKFGITGNINKPNISHVLTDLVRFLQKNGIGFYLDKELASKVKENLPRGAVLECKKLINQSDAIISFGGDGTFLNTARLAGKKDIPILGVNLGNLGFMAEVQPAEMKKFIQDIIKGKYRISERAIIAASLTAGSTLYGINDIVIDRARSIRMLEIEVFYNNEFVVKFVADGAIISTPTGSTGYSLSAGGPIITQGSEVFILTPICAHTLNVRPIIFPDTGKLLIKVKSHEDVRITADGQVFKTIKSPTEFNLEKASHKIKIIKKVKSNYFKTLSKKLLLGADRRKY